MKNDHPTGPLDPASPNEAVADAGPPEALEEVSPAIPTRRTAAAHPGEDDIVTVLSDHYGLPRWNVLAWLRESDWERAS